VELHLHGVQRDKVPFNSSFFPVLSGLARTAPDYWNHVKLIPRLLTVEAKTAGGGKQKLFCWRFLCFPAVNVTVIDDDVSRPLLSLVLWSME
jgi:hypothetical protein